jgi:L-threonylcarbamoyladenylate synthase
MRKSGQESVNIENVSAMTKPERIPLNSLLLSPRGRQKLKEIAFAARKGALFVYPTETIYGIGGLYNVKGVKDRLSHAKHKDPRQHFILIASQRSVFKRLPIIFMPSAEKLARKFWPGPLTMVLPSGSAEEGFAIRISDHPFIKAFFDYVDQPLFSTSANISGKEYINDPEVIFTCFAGKIDFFIDAGRLLQSRPSTVVRIETDNTVNIIREGEIPVRNILSALQ